MNPHLQKLQFSNGLQKLESDIYQELYPRLFQEDFNRESLLTKEACKNMTPDGKKLALKIHQMILSRFQNIGAVPVSDPDRLLIPARVIESIEKEAARLKTAYPENWDKTIKAEKLKATISKFVEEFNEQFSDRKPHRERALEYIAEIKRASWEFKDETATVPKADEISNARLNLFQLFLCKDRRVKEAALQALTELMEWDPLEEDSGNFLVSLQNLLLNEIRAANAQDINKSLQRKLIKTYAISIECFLLHSALDHLNAMADDTKQENWSGAKELEGLNTSDDPEIKFWAKYAIQGIQHIKSDKSTLESVIERLGMLAHAGVLIGVAVANPSDTASLLIDIFNDLRGSIHHIQWKKEWFNQLLVLKRLCRYASVEPAHFRILSRTLRDKKKRDTNEELMYGTVTLIENILLNSPSKEIHEEGLKLLLDYFTIEHLPTRKRVVEALERIACMNEAPLGNTAYGVMKMLDAAGKLPDRNRLPPRAIAKGALFENILKFLLLRLAEIKGGLDISGHSLMTVLCKSQEQKIVPSLLKCLSELCPDFQGPDPSGNTVFHVMIRQGFFASMDLITPEMKAFLNVQEHERQYTALHDAVQIESEGAVSFLTQLQANPNLQDRDGNTPLHNAVALQNEKIAQLLLGGGADPNLLNKEGKTALNLSIESGNGAMTLLLMAHEGSTPEAAQGITPRMLAAQAHQRELFKALKGKADYKKAQKRTELHQAVIAGNRQEIRNLVEQGFSINQPDHEGNTPLHLAAFRRDHRAIALLLELTADPLAKNHFGDTPLLLVCGSIASRGPQGLSDAEKKQGHEVNALKKLIEKGASVQDYDALHNNALQRAALAGSAPLIRYLTKKFPQMLWERNIHGTIAAENAIYHTPNLENEENISQHLMTFHQKLLECTQNRLPLGNLLVYANKAALFKMLLDLDAGMASFCDGSPLQHTPLHIAAITGNCDILRIYCDRNLNLDEPDALGNSAAHLAAYYKKAPFLELLKAKGCPFTQKNRDKRTPLHLAAESRSVEVITAVKNENNEMEVDNRGDTALHIAARLGGEEILGLFYPGKSTVNDDGNSPLHIACIYGNLPGVRFLFQKKEKTELKNTLGQTPILLAAQEGHAAIVCFLLNVGADIYSQDEEGETLLHKAVFHHHEEVILQVLEEEQGLIPPHRGGLANLDDRLGETPLHELPKISAQGNGNSPIDILRALLKARANPKAANQLGETFLHVAAQYGRVDLLNALLKQKRKISLIPRDAHKNTPLHKAVLGGHLEVIKALCRRKRQSGIRKKNDEGLTPLLLAIKEGFWEGARTLISFHAKPRAKTDAGETLFHLLLNRPVLDTAGGAFLADAVGSFPKLLKVQDKQGNTPLHLIADHNHHNLLFVLRFLPGKRKKKKERYLRLKNAEDFTALSLADNKQHTETAKKLRNFSKVFLGADYRGRSKPLKHISLKRHPQRTLEEEMKQLTRTTLIVQNPNKH